jgi:hypothetical protein
MRSMVYKPRVRKQVFRLLSRGKVFEVEGKVRRPPPAGAFTSKAETTSDISAHNSCRGCGEKLWGIWRERRPRNGRKSVRVSSSPWSRKVYTCIFRASFVLPIYIVLTPHLRGSTRLERIQSACKHGRDKVCGEKYLVGKFCPFNDHAFWSEHKRR